MLLGPSQASSPAASGYAALSSFVRKLVQDLDALGLLTQALVLLLISTLLKQSPSFTRGCRASRYGPAALSLFRKF